MLREHLKTARAWPLLVALSLLVAAPVLASPASRARPARSSAPQEIEGARSLYEDALASLALGEWQIASDRFHLVWLAAEDLQARGQLADEQLSEARTLSQKAEHLGSQARQAACLAQRLNPAGGVPGSDLSSYIGYDSPPSRAPQLPGVKPEMNQDVKKWLDFYVQDGSKVFGKWLSRSRQYLDMVQSILASEGMPTELAYLILVESGFDLRARSWKHAVGPWQFILGTARLFGLRVDPWIDERCDLERSTVAAARYLRQLYSEFESWPLALAAYNTGEGRVRRAVMKQNTRDFWSLRLPRQTKDYVPQFMAALHIVSEPEKYGFNDHLPAPVSFEEVMVFGPVDLRDVAAVCGASLDSMRVLNPAFRNYVSPARKGGTKVRVPAGKGEEYLSRLARDEIQAERADSWSRSGSGGHPGAEEELRGEADPAAQSSLSRRYEYEFPPVEDELYITYRVRKGDCLYTIARNFGVSVQAIQEFNEIGKRNIIRPGQKLLVPREDVKLSRRSSQKGGKRSAEVVHVVRSGDTLHSISRSYGVSVKDIVRWNSVRNPRLIRPGQKLAILPD
ncbi:MAG: LysM peptidoglycan-binding domain-containing protein [Candidatus Eiseniibacteriota bacterium]|nr:MAG: LysM peptidoglycan-binding domain-containing protein [Candidatus Eisenbacteria bacterium]